MPLDNYEIARKHWQQWASNPDLTDDERKKYALPAAPKHSAFLKQKFESFGDSLCGVIAQQVATQHYRTHLTDVKQRDIIHREIKTEGFTPDDVRKKKAALKLHRKKKQIINNVNRDEFEALQALKKSAIESEIAKLEKEKQEKEEKNKVANAEAIKEIEKSIAELRAFLTQLPQITEAIEAFTTQQIRLRLSQASLYRAATENPITIGSSAQDKLNQGLALTEKEKKEGQTSIIRVSGRFFNDTLALTVEATPNAEGGTDYSYNIPAGSFNTNKYGLPGINYLFEPGRMDLAKSIHEDLVLKGKKAFTIDFSTIDAENIKWHIQFLEALIKVSMKNSNSAQMLSNDASIESLNDYLKKHSWAAWALGKKTITRMKQRNNECSIKKSEILRKETKIALDNLKMIAFHDPVAVAKNAAVAGEQLAISAHNEIAKTLAAIDLVSADIGLVSAAMGKLIAVEKLAQSAYKDARSLINNAKKTLKRLSGEHKHMPQLIVLKELEQTVVAANENLKKTEAALERLRKTKEIFHDAFATKGAETKIDVTTAFGDKHVAIRLLALLIGMDSASVNNIAKILFAADRILAPHQYADLAAAYAAFNNANPANRVAMIEHSLDINFKDTMNALTEAYDTIRNEPQDFKKIAAMIVVGRPEADAEAAVVVDLQTAAENIVNRDSAIVLAKKNVPNAVEKVTSDATSAQNIGVHETTARAVYEKKAIANDIAKIDITRTVSIINSSPENMEVIGKHINTANAVVENAEIAIAVAKLDGVTTINSIIADNESISAIINTDPKRIEAIVEILAQADEGIAAPYDVRLVNARAEYEADPIVAIARAKETGYGVDAIRTIITEMLTRDSTLFKHASDSVRLQIIKQVLANWTHVPEDLKVAILEFMLDPINATRFASTFELVTPGLRLRIIRDALADWTNVPDTIKPQIIAVMLDPMNADRFLIAFRLTTPEVQVAILKAALADHPTAFNAFDSDVKREVLAAVIAKNSTNPDIKKMVANILYDADPIAISANSSIEALAPVVAAENGTNTDPAAALRKTLSHNPAEGLLILNRAYEMGNKDSSINPKFVRDALNNRDSQLENFIKKGIADCNKEILDAQRTIKKNDLALDFDVARENAAFVSERIDDRLSKFYQQLTTNPKAIKFDIATGEVRFKDGQKTIMLKAEEARDIVNKVAKGYEQYLAKVETIHQELLDMAKATNAVENELNTGLPDRVKQDKKNLDGIVELPKEIINNLAHAKDFLYQLREQDDSGKSLKFDEKSPLGQLFDVSVVTAANDVVAATEKELKDLKEAKEKLYESIPVETRKLDTNNPVGAKETDPVPLPLITKEVINGGVMPPEIGSSIQRARAQDYINLINKDPVIKKIRDDGDTPTDNQITAAKIRVFQNNKNVQDARVIALGAVAITDGNLHNILSTVNQDNAQALRVLEQIALNQYKENTSPLKISPVDAANLLVKIHIQDNVYQAINEALDKQPESKKEWARIVEKSEVFEKNVRAIQAASENIVSKKAIVVTVAEQLKNNKPLMSSLNEKRVNVEKVQVAKAVEYRKALEHKEKALNEAQALKNKRSWLPSLTQSA